MSSRDALILDRLPSALRDYFNFESKIGWSLSYFEDRGFFKQGTEEEQLLQLRLWENKILEEQGAKSANF